MSNILLQFHAEWCGPCKRVSPILKQIAEETEGLVLKQTDVDKYPTDAAAWEVQSVPTVIHLDEDGKEIARVVGAKPKSILLNLLKI